MTLTKTKIIAFLIVLVTAFSLLGFRPSQHASVVRGNFISDPQSVLSYDALNRLHAILEETQHKQGLSIRISIISDISQLTFDDHCEALFEKNKAMEPGFFAQTKWAFWIINAKTAESRILVNLGATLSPYWMDGLNNLEKYAIEPALAHGDLESALFQGVFGLTTLFKPNLPPKSKNLIEKTVELYQRSLWFHGLVLFLAIIAAGMAIRWYLRTPVTSSIEDDEAPYIVNRAEFLARRR